MGLAASQARLLSLAMRQNDNELRGQKINNRRLALSSKMDAIATAYSKGMSNTRLIIRQDSTSDTMVAFNKKSLELLGLCVINNSTHKELTIITEGDDKGKYKYNGKVLDDTDLAKLIETDQVSIATKADTDTAGTVHNNIIDWRSDESSRVGQELDESDDKAVAAQYEAESTKVQTADKRLEMELKDLDTQHKAIETEVDAVKKVIDKNIQGSFKTFG